MLLKFVCEPVTLVEVTLDTEALVMTVDGGSEKVRGAVAETTYGHGSDAYYSLPWTPRLAYTLQVCRDDLKNVDGGQNSCFAHPARLCQWHTTGKQDLFCGPCLEREQ